MKGLAEAGRPGDNSWGKEETAKVLPSSHTSPQVHRIYSVSEKETGHFQATKNRHIHVALTWNQLDLTHFIRIDSIPQRGKDGGRHKMPSMLS